MESKNGSSVRVEIINQSEESMRKSRRLMLDISYCFLPSRYAVISTILVLKVLEIIRVSQTKDSRTTTNNLFDSLRTFVSADLIMIPTLLWLSSLFILVLIYTVEATLKEPEITMKSLMIQILKKLKNMGAAPKFFVCFLCTGYLSFSFFLILAALLLRSLSVAASAMTLGSAVLLVYFDLFFLQRILASVSETGGQGLTATGMSEDEIEEQKISLKRIKYRLTILYIFICLFNMTPLCLFVHGDVSSLLVQFILAWNLFVVEIFEFDVNALFYLRRTSEPVEELVMEEKEIYSRVSSAGPSTEDISLV